MPGLRTLLGKVRRRVRYVWRDLWARPTVIVLIRYSVFLRTHASRVWLVSQEGTPDDYRNKLFDDARLQFRLATLTRVVLPSLDGQSVGLHPSRHRVIIFTSTELPENHLAALRSAVADTPWVSVELVPPDCERIDFAGPAGRAIAQMGHRGLYATVRLDDDDALARTFVKNLGRHVGPENVGKIISFPKGYMGKLNDGAPLRFDGFFERSTGFNATGMAFIASTEDEPSTVFDIGAHDRAGSVPHFRDTGIRAWLRSWHPGMDSGGTYRNSSWLRRPATEARVRKDFTTLA